MTLNKPEHEKRQLATTVRLNGTGWFKNPLQRAVAIGRTVMVYSSG